MSLSCAFFRPDHACTDKRGTEYSSSHCSLGVLPWLVLMRGTSLAPVSSRIVRPSPSRWLLLAASGFTEHRAACHGSAPSSRFSGACGMPDTLMAETMFCTITTRMLLKPDKVSGWMSLIIPSLPCRHLCTAGRAQASISTSCLSSSTAGAGPACGCFCGASPNAAADKGCMLPGVPTASTRLINLDACCTPASSRICFRPGLLQPSLILVSTLPGTMTCRYGGGARVASSYHFSVHGASPSQGPSSSSRGGHTTS
mmetsp:Transcript_7203/g.17821  ORF Transcript_7203/g.17821 Transcript_7203/m.17821 type:complete len:256 (-) Transcript_7203:2027-2794(-)